jgi:hypothetical protein
MIVNRSLKELVFRLPIAELCSHKSLIIRNGPPSRGKGFARDYAVKARPKPRMRASPRMVDAQENVPIEEYLPPVTLLKSAYKAGVLKVEPEAALNVIRRYLHVSASEPVGWEKRFLEGTSRDHPPTSIDTHVSTNRRKYHTGNLNYHLFDSKPFQRPTSQNPCQASHSHRVLPR